ncbi:MAG: hypothetical protein L0Z53_19100 [Acidobacteriales bacterium]|nr:hypothetical protein [Terriglobales bacterium]
MTRAEVYKLIDGERDYQDANKGNARSDLARSYSVAEWLNMIATYLRKAQDAWSGPHPEGIDLAKHNVRKIAALAVVCMEQNGAPPRE